MPNGRARFVRQVPSSSTRTSAEMPARSRLMHWSARRWGRPRPWFSGNTTRKSKSLSEWASPRAREPNSQSSLTGKPARRACTHFSNRISAVSIIASVADQASGSTLRCQRPISGGRPHSVAALWRAPLHFAGMLCPGWALVTCEAIGLAPESCGAHQSTATSRTDDHRLAVAAVSPLNRNGPPPRKSALVIDGHQYFSMCSMTSSLPRK